MANVSQPTAKDAFLSVQLPPDESLDIDAFSKLFDMMNQSYKLFWFRGILEGVLQGKSTQRFGDIVNLMATEGWDLVIRQKKSLGPVDAIERLVKALEKETGLPAEADRETVLCAVAHSKDSEVNKLKLRLIQSVPYRLQSPFMKGENWQDWENYGLTIAKINSIPSMIYTIGFECSLDTELQIKPAWMKYLTNNFGKIVRWTDEKLLTFLKKNYPGMNNDASGKKQDIKIKKETR